MKTRIMLVFALCITCCIGYVISTKNYMMRKSLVIMRAPKVNGGSIIAKKIGLRAGPLIEEEIRRITADLFKEEFLDYMVKRNRFKMDKESLEKAVSGIEVIVTNLPSFRMDVVARTDSLALSKCVAEEYCEYIKDKIDTLSEKGRLKAMSIVSSRLSQILKHADTDREVHDKLLRWHQEYIKLLVSYEEGLDRLVEDTNECAADLKYTISSKIWRRRASEKMGDSDSAGHLENQELKKGLLIACRDMSKDFSVLSETELQEVVGNVLVSVEKGGREIVVSASDANPRRAIELFVACQYLILEKAVAHGEGRTFVDVAKISLRRR